MKLAHTINKILNKQINLHGKDIYYMAILITFVFTLFVVVNVNQFIMSMVHDNPIGAVESIISFCIDTGIIFYISLWYSLARKTLNASKK